MADRPHSHSGTDSIDSIDSTDSTDSTPHPLSRLRIPTAAIIYGAITGALAGVLYTAMHYSQHALWNVTDQRWMIFPIMAIAGVLIAAIGTRIPNQTLDEQLHSAATLRDYHRGRGLWIALSAFIAVVAGGAVGPEAGIIALTTELSALVTLRISEAKLKALLPAVGVGASVGAVWGSPAAGATYDSDELSPGTALNVVAAAAGFVGFIGVLSLTHTSSIRMDISMHLDFSPVLITSVVAACLVGTAAAFLYRWLDSRSSHLMDAIISRVGNRTWVVIGMSLVLAAVCTAWPWLRFSGQEDLPMIVHNPHLLTTGALIGGAIAKLAAVVLTLRAGWRGGEIFPLLLAGTMLGAGTAMMSASLFDATTSHLLGAAAVAGVSALLTGVSGKPVVAILLIIFLVPGVAFVPILAGVAFGMLASTYGAERATSH